MNFVKGIQKALEQQKMIDLWKMSFSNDAVRVKMPITASKTK